MTLTSSLTETNRLDTKIFEIEAEVVESEEAISSISHHITQVKCLVGALVPLQSTSAYSDTSKEPSPLLRTL